MKQKYRVNVVGLQNKEGRYLAVGEVVSPEDFNDTVNLWQLERDGWISKARE